MEKINSRVQNKFRDFIHDQRTSFLIIYNYFYFNEDWNFMKMFNLQLIITVTTIYI